MRIDRLELEHQARIERARQMAELFAGAIVAVTHFVMRAWHALTSGAPRPMIK